MTCNRVVIAAIIFALGACEKGDSTPAVELSRSVEQLEASLVPEEVEHEALAWKKFGIATAKTVPAPRGIGHRVILLSAEGKELGEVDVTDKPDGTNWIVIRLQGKELIIETKGEFHGDLANSTMVVRLYDLVTGRKGESHFDIAFKGFVEDAMSTQLEAEFGDFFPIAYGTDAAIKRQYNDTTDLLKKKQNEASGNTRIDALALACNGAWYRGGTVWGALSECCVIARDRAAVQCSNRWCLGCCEYRACDYYCRMGSYGCMCGISGRACGY